MIEHLDMSSQFFVFCACQVMWSEKALSIIVIERLSDRKNGQLIFSGTSLSRGLHAVIETLKLCVIQIIVSIAQLTLAVL